MRLASICREYSTLSGRPLSDVETRARRLREAGLVPNGKGVGAPDARPRDVARLILGSMCAPGAGALLTALPVYSSLRAIDGPTLLARLTEILTDQQVASSVLRLVVSQTYPCAYIEFKDRNGRLARVEEYDDGSENRTSVQTTEVSLPGYVLAKLSSDIRDEEPIGELVH